MCAGGQFRILNLESADKCLEGALAHVRRGGNGKGLIIPTHRDPREREGSMKEVKTVCILHTPILYVLCYTGRMSPYL